MKKSYLYLAEVITKATNPDKRRNASWLVTKALEDKDSDIAKLQKEYDTLLNRHNLVLNQIRGVRTMDEIGKQL